MMCPENCLVKTWKKLLLKEVGNKKGELKVLYFTKLEFLQKKREKLFESLLMNSFVTEFCH